MATLRMAQEAGVRLLSLPDKLLGEIALKTIDQRPGSEPFKDWTRAASTCKRLWELQLFSDPTIQKYGGIKWYIRRFANAMSICIDVDKWPEGFIEKRKLANSIVGVSGNLRQLERLDFGPSRNYLRSLSPWMSVMLAGACNLRHLRLAAELLACLPQSGRQALESLHIDAKDAAGVRHALSAVKDCQRLRSLTIVCHHGPAQPDDKPPEIAELDLRHLDLTTCHLHCVPAPGSIFLPRGELELTIAPQQIATWSKLWYKIKDYVPCLKIEGYPQCAWHAQPAQVLATWPKEIVDFHGLQFLQVTCEGAGSLMQFPSEKILDLAHVAHIPHVSIQSKGDMFVEISEGSWEFLELKSARVMHVDVQDPVGFLLCTEVFSFTFSADARPSYLIEKLEDTVKEVQRNTGTEIPRKLYEYHDSPNFLCDKLGDEPSLVEFTNRHYESISGESAYENAFLGARIRTATSAGYPKINHGGLANNLGLMHRDSFSQKLPSPVKPTNKGISGESAYENGFPGALTRSASLAGYPERSQRESILGMNANENASLGTRIRSATAKGYPETRYVGIAENLRRIQKECAS